jgi:hypothetical protein
MGRGCLLILLLTIPAFIQAQTGNPRLESFRLDRAGNSIQVSWTVSPGNGCNGVRILYSPDSISFSVVYDYPGVCGNTSQSEKYFFVHNDPRPGMNYYQVDLGSEGVSNVLGINFVQYGPGGFLVIPEGRPGISTVYFENSARESWTLEIYSLSGVLVQRRVDIYDDKVETAPVERNGVYILRLTNSSGTVISGKFLVQ